MMSHLAAANERIVELGDALDRAERRITELERERDEARKEREAALDSCAELMKERDEARAAGKTHREYIEALKDEAAQSLQAQEELREARALTVEQGKKLVKMRSLKAALSQAQQERDEARALLVDKGMRVGTKQTAELGKALSQAQETLREREASLDRVLTIAESKRRRYSVEEWHVLLAERAALSPPTTEERYRQVVDAGHGVGDEEPFDPSLDT